MFSSDLGPGLPRLALIVTAVVFLGRASLNDLATRNIPDLSALAVLLTGIVLRLIDGTAAIAFGISAVVFAIGVTCWRYGWLGGGDTKLLAACCWLTPPYAVPDMILTTALAGGMLACVYLTWRGVSATSDPPMARSRQPLGRHHCFAVRVWRIECRRVARHPTLPYGCAIAAGTFITLVRM